MTTTDSSPKDADPRPSAPDPSTSLLKGSIRFFTIVLMVTAAAAPLVVVSTYIPISYAHGSGLATSLTYLAATAILLLFAVGFAQMAKRITAAGAFYHFATKGLGRPVGLGTGWTIMLAYSMIAPAISGRIPTTSTRERAWPALMTSSVGPSSRAGTARTVSPANRRLTHPRGHDVRRRASLLAAIQPNP